MTRSSHFLTKHRPFGVGEHHHQQADNSPHQGGARHPGRLRQPADEETAKRCDTLLGPQVDTEDPPTQYIRNVNLDERVHHHELSNGGPAVYGNQHQCKR